MDFFNIFNTIDLILIANLIILFIIKIIDNVIQTGKTILVQKGKGVLAALTVIVSQVIFYKLIDAVSKSGDNITIYVIAIGSGFGTYLAIKINEKISKERTYVNVIMSDNKEAMIELRDYLKEHKITNIATDAYTKDWEKTIAITAYTETKAENKLLDKYILESETKFKRVITKE